MTPLQRPLSVSPAGPNRRLTIIAPCYNEVANIDSLVDRMLRTFDRMDVAGELLLVDDGSRDRTWLRIQHRASLDPRVRGLRHETNRGIEAAWHTGLRAATSDLIGLIDADLQNRPEDVARLYRTWQAGGADMVQAVRRPAPGVTQRRLFSRGLNFLLNRSFGMRLRDNKSGFILCPAEVLRELLRHRLRYRYFQSFLGAAAGVRGFCIAEVDTSFDPRHAGKSFLPRFPIRVSVRILWELIKFRWETLPLRQPASAAHRPPWPSPAPLSEAPTP